MYIYIQTCTHVYMFMHMHLGIETRMYMQCSFCVFVSTFTYIHLYMYMYINIDYTHIYIYMYVYIQVCIQYHTCVYVPMFIFLSWLIHTHFFGSQYSCDSFCSSAQVCNQRVGSEPLRTPSYVKQICHQSTLRSNHGLEASKGGLRRDHVEGVASMKLCDAEHRRVAWVRLLRWLLRQLSKAACSLMP